MRTVFALFLVLLTASCAGVKPPVDTKAENATQATYTPVAFSAVPQWAQQDHAPALLALRASCDVLMKRDPAATVAPTALAGTIADWQPACQALKTHQGPARAFFEAHFIPYKITTPFGDTGLYTGYYEAQIDGSRVKTDTYNVPVYKRPSDLVMVDLGQFRPHLKGERIAGRVIDGTLKPYADRAQIDSGALAGKNLELAWVSDADALFFMHIQGSGRIHFADGSVMRVGYDGQNGHVYTAIGRELIARGILTPETTSLQTIRAWLKANPDQAPALRQKNASFIFFRELPGDKGAVGAQGVPLTPLGSVAVDPRFVPYGAPVVIDTAHPVDPERRLRKLLIAQDTGGAIRGPVRGDVFWGFGQQAEDMSGIMKARGQSWVLLPKTLGNAPRSIALVVKK